METTSPLMILITGVPKSGKTTAITYFKEQLNVKMHLTIDPTFTGFRSGKWKLIDPKYILVDYNSSVLGNPDYSDYGSLYGLTVVDHFKEYMKQYGVEKCIHIHLFNEQLEVAFEEFCPEVCLSNLKADLVLENSIYNHNFIFQLDDVIEIIRGGQLN